MGHQGFADDRLTPSKSREQRLFRYLIRIPAPKAVLREAGFV